MKSFKLIILFSGIVLLMSCKKQCYFTDSDLSECVQQRLEEFKGLGDAHSFALYRFREKNWYFLDRQHAAVDGADYFIDSKCDTVCLICGECQPPVCSEEVVFVRDIWKK